MKGSIGYLTNSQIGQCGWAYFETFDQWERTLFPLGVWFEPDVNTLPSALRRQLRQTKISLDAIVVDREDLEKQLADIKEGAQLIGDLPVDARLFGVLGGLAVLRRKLGRPKVGQKRPISDLVFCGDG